MPRWIVFIRSWLTFLICKTVFCCRCCCCCRRRCCCLEESLFCRLKKLTIISGSSTNKVNVKLWMGFKLWISEELRVWDLHVLAGVRSTIIGKPRKATRMGVEDYKNSAPLVTKYKALPIRTKATAFFVIWSYPKFWVTSLPV